MAKKFKKKAPAGGPKTLSLKDPRIKELQIKNAQDIRKKSKPKDQKKPGLDSDKYRLQKHAKVAASTLYFNYNLSLGPPYQIICDTNFINFAIKNKLDIKQNMMNCLLAKCIPYATDCIIAELEKLGAKYRVALQIVKNSFEVLPCSHKGTYADDCIMNRISQFKCYMVATCDRALKKRIRKVPGIPIMYVKSHQFAIERMPDLPAHS